MTPSLKSGVQPGHIRGFTLDQLHQLTNGTVKSSLIQNLLISVTMK